MAKARGKCCTQAVVRKDKRCPPLHFGGGKRGGGCEADAADFIPFAYFDEEESAKKQIADSEFREEGMVG